MKFPFAGPLTICLSIFFASNFTTNLYLSFSSTAALSANTDYSILINYNGDGLVNGFTVTIDESPITPNIARDTLGSNNTVTANQLNIGQRTGASNKLNGTSNNFTFKYL